MNRERAKELLPIIQAFAEGKAVQWRSPPLYKKWESTDNPFWCDEKQDMKNTWRIKPEPREFWIPGNDEGWMKRNAMTNEEKEKADWGNSWIKVRIIE